MHEKGSTVRFRLQDGQRFCSALLPTSHILTTGRSLALLLSTARGWSAGRVAAQFIRQAPVDVEVSVLEEPEQVTYDVALDDADNYQCARITILCIGGYRYGPFTPSTLLGWCDAPSTFSCGRVSARHSFTGRVQLSPSE